MQLTMANHNGNTDVRNSQTKLSEAIQQQSAVPPLMQTKNNKRLGPEGITAKPHPFCPLDRETREQECYAVMGDTSMEGCMTTQRLFHTDLRQASTLQSQTPSLTIRLVKVAYVVSDQFE